MKTYKCQFCNYKLVDNGQIKRGNNSPKFRMGQHYEEKHKNLIPENMDGWRWFYFTQTKKDHGSCVICHKDTEFNKITMKYSRFCSNPACKQAYREERDKRMMGKYGKLYVTDDPEMQKKMLENRKISGTYQWSDGKTKFGYVGSYELDFLRHLDLDLQWPAGDLVTPSPHTYTYEYGGKQHVYIPDMFIPSKTLELEIKSSVRMERQNSESREKEIEKDKMMRSCSNIINYMILYDKNYTDFDTMVSKDD